MKYTLSDMKYTLTFLCAWLSLFCYGQSYKLFTADRDLSSTLINQIYQDHNSMIWVATENGLNRYDGAKFVAYKHDPQDKHSLCHNLVRVLSEDSHGHLFVGTYAGLQVYDPATDHFSAPATWEDGSPFTSNILKIAELRNGEIWLSGNTLCKLEFKGDRPIVKKIAWSDIPLTNISLLLEDRKGNIWLCAEKSNLYRLDANKRIHSYLKEEKELFLIDICEDSHGDIYLGSIGKGLLKYDKEHDNFVPVSDDSNRNLPINTLYATGSGELLIGTDGQGVKIYDSRKQQFTDYRIGNSNFRQGSSKVHSILKDNIGNYWFALYQKGVMVIPAVPNNFTYIGHKSIDKDFIGTSCVTTFCRDHEGNLWIGTDNDGIYGMTGNLTLKTHYSPSDRTNGVPPTVLTLYEDSKQNLWVGSFTKGLGRLNRHTGEYTSFEGLTGRDGNVVQRVYDLVEDREQRLWIATMGAGLFWYDLKTNQLHNRWQREDEYINEWMTCLLLTRDNKLYTGTYDGIFCIDLSKPEMPSTLITREHIIFTLYEDPEGKVWMGSSKGLLCWDPKSRKLSTSISYSTAYDIIYAIQEDNRSNLWISTNNGLLQFNKKEGQTIHYYVEDGLQGNEFSKNASYRDKDGTLWFGGMNGITCFNPQEIVNPAKKWNVRITALYLHDKPVHKGMLSGGEEIIDKPVFETQTFRLSHEDNTFSIEFATQGYNHSERITYLYSLDDEQWITLPIGSNRVSFSNLASGTHHFRVKAVDHALHSNIREVTIYITPAWYETWWAHLLGFLVIAGIVGLVILSILHRYRSKQQMLEYIHAKEIDEAKFQFFVNISHEIRTPMSLVISPLLKLMQNDKDESRQQVYRLIHRNAERILRLINQLMDMRKIEKGQMNLRFQETEIIHNIEELCQSFAPAKQEKNITLLFHHEGMEQLTLWVSPDYFEKIIINVLSNAFKFTPKEGQIDISISRKENPANQPPLQQYVEIIVADNGPSIDPSEIERIFQRFYQTGNSSSANGTGIGLHLTRSLVTLHHGTIHAENNTDSPGCRFVIRLPEGHAHLRPEELETGNTEVTEHTPSVSEAVLTGESPAAPRVYAKTKYKILVVEDNAEIREYIRQELSTDYHITESSNGKEALEQIFNIQPDLVISDVMMPEMDGMELCRRVKQNINLNHIPVILLTAKVRDTDNIEGLKMGADAYITKPFNIEVLRQTAKNLIQGRERLKNTFSNNQTQEKKQKKIEAQSANEKLMERIMAVINDNLDNPDLSVKTITETVGISRVHLHRKLKELTNQSTSDFIRNVRLQQAARLMQEKKYSINEVARLTGFPDPNYFSTVFKNLYGVSPSVYMNEHQ